MVVSLWFSAIVAYAQNDSSNIQHVSAEPELVDGKNVIRDLTPADSVAALKMAGKKAKRDWATWKPDPKRAMWLAIVIPGAGQIYNHKYWKLPIIYGGFVGCAYAMRWNNQMYSDYSRAYIDISDNDPETKSYEKFPYLVMAQSDPERLKAQFKSRKDRFRRWRDLSFFCMLGVYGLSIIDAYVDASLSQFDISDDLSLHVEPGFVGTSRKESWINSEANPSSTTGIGINAALTF